MTEERYALLEERLEEHKQRLQRRLGVRLDDVRAHNRDGKLVETLDAADASVSDLEQTFGIALLELASQSLRQVEQALARLESGDYGLCADCNERIAGKRLQALPFAVRCRACEDLREIGERSRTSARSQDPRLAYDDDLQHFTIHARE
jgi:DnaK suppressor protein